MLYRIITIILTLSFIFSAPKGFSKNKKGMKILPAKNIKKEKPIDNKQLTYKEVALELQKSKNIKSRLSILEQQAVVALIAGKRKGGTYLKHLTNAMKKHKCYVGKNKNEKLNKFRKWPTKTAPVQWFDLDCKIDGSSPINPKENSKKNNGK